MPLEAGLEAAATAELPLAFELAILLHFTANQSLSIFKAFNDYFEDGRILLPELPKITTHTSVWSRPQLRLVEAAVQALEQL